MGAAAPGEVETLQHPAEDGVGEQVCEEKGGAGALLFPSQASLEEKHILGGTFSLGGFGDHHPPSSLPLPGGCT